MFLITGANGQLGSELCRLLDEQQRAYLATDRADLDVTDAPAVQRLFASVQPSAVFHCAAYTAVDAAEGEGKAANRRVNTDGSRIVAQAAAAVGAVLVFPSTDYVFSGELPLGAEWEATDPKRPVNEYGRAKLAGEEAIAASGARCYVVRTAWVFGNYGANFVRTMQTLAAKQDTISVVADQYGRPTWTRTLAEFLLYLIDHECPYGTYQLTNDSAVGEYVSWYDFAREILTDENIEVLPIASTEFPRPAKRPANSAMSLATARATGFEIPNWQDALAQMLREGTPPQSG